MHLLDIIVVILLLSAVWKGWNREGGLITKLLGVVISVTITALILALLFYGFDRVAAEWPFREKLETSFSYRPAVETIDLLWSKLKQVL